MNKTITFLKKSAALFCFSVILMGTFACTDKNKDNPAGGDNNNQPPAVTSPENQQANANQPSENNPNPPGPGENQPGPDNNQPGPDNNQPGPEDNQQNQPNDNNATNNPNTPDNSQTNQPQQEVSNKPINMEALNNEVVITDKQDVNYGKTRKELALADPENFFVQMSDEEYVKYATRLEGTPQEIKDSVDAITKYADLSLSFDKHKIEKLIANHTEADIKQLSKNAAEDYVKMSEKFRELENLEITKETNYYYYKATSGVHTLVNVAEQASHLAELKSDEEVTRGLNDIRFALDCAKDDLDSGKRVAADVLKDYCK